MSMPATGQPVVPDTPARRTEARTLAGFQAHIAKPVDPAELLAAVASLARPARDARP